MEDDRLVLSSSDKRSVRGLAQRELVSATEVNYNPPPLVLLRILIYEYYDSWSPEGTFLAVPNSVNNGVFVAGIMKRRDWAQATSLIGHDNVVDVTVRPFLFSVPKPFV